MSFCTNCGTSINAANGTLKQLPIIGGLNIIK